MRLAKLRRACERWTKGDKALAHIHLAHAGLPPCEEERALRLFVADEILKRESHRLAAGDGCRERARRRSHYPRGLE
ncbi:MAG: hypothetical protein M3Z96_06725 [Pseudomonadota bacterium]|nr:hypothetical protein [Pseudomonadota bacterium]